MPQLQDHIEELEGHFYVKDESGSVFYIRMQFQTGNRPQKNSSRSGTSILIEMNAGPQKGTTHLLLTAIEWSENSSKKNSSSKTQMTQKYLKTFGNSIEKNDQMRVAQQIVNLLGLHLQGSYFTQSYWVHCGCLQAQLNLVANLL